MRARLRAPRRGHGGVVDGGHAGSFAAASRSRRAQTIRPPPVVVSVPQPSGPVRASTTSRPCGRPSGCLRRHGPPRVFGLDPDMIRVQLGADGEVPGPAAGVQDGVGRQLGCDEDGIGGGRASRQVAGDGAADVVQLVGSPWVGGGMPGGGGWFGCHDAGRLADTGSRAAPVARRRSSRTVCCRSAWKAVSLSRSAGGKSDRSASRSTRVFTSSNCAGGVEPDRPGHLGVPPACAVYGTAGATTSPPLARLAQARGTSEPHPRDF